ncbi:MAG: hypothetical protein AAFR76_13190, partial [Planctomycetota bacterium]
SASQVVTGLVAGERYELSVFANRDDVPGGTRLAEAVELVVESTGSPTRVLDSIRFPVSQIETGSDFSRLRLEFGAIEPSARVRLRVTPSAFGPRDGAVKFDDAVVAPLP